MSEKGKCTEGVEWPHCEVRVKEELDARETAAEQLVWATMRAAGVSPVLTLYHARARTCADADANAAGLRGAFTKTLFLCDCAAPPTHWLVLTVGSARPDLAALKRALGARGKLRMCTEADLLARLGLTPGAVTPLALVRDAPAPGQKPIRFVVDRVLWKNPAYEGLLNVHPMHNAASTTLAADDLLRYLAHTGHGVHAYIDTTVSPMGIEVVEKDVLEHDRELAAQQQQAAQQAAKEKSKDKADEGDQGKKGKKGKKKGAETPEEAARKRRLTAATVLSAAGAALGCAAGALDGTHGAADALGAIRAHAGGAQATALGGIAVAGAAWPAPAHVVQHVAAAEALLSGKRGADLARIVGARLATADVAARWHDAGADSADAACRVLSFGPALAHEPLADTVASVLACCGAAAASARVAACTAAFFARLAFGAEPAAKPAAWPRAVVDELLPAVRAAAAAAAAAEDSDALAAACDEAGALWDRYCRARMPDGADAPVFGEGWAAHPETRDAFYAATFGAAAESCRAVCATVVACDALVLAETVADAEARWERLLEACAFGRATTHTMAVAAYCYGLRHELAGVPDGHHKKIELLGNLSRVAANLAATL